MKKTIGGGIPLTFQYDCWKCPKWHETDEPVAAARFAKVRITSPLGVINLPDVTYLMQLRSLSDFSLTAFVNQYVQRCTTCNRLKLIKNLWYESYPQALCFECC
jgi:hypothetical protein